MSDSKIKKSKRKAKSTADKALESEDHSPTKKQAVQGLSSASSPASVASASPKIPPVVASAPLASKRAAKKVVRFEYGYPIEGHHYRPSDEFSDDDDDASIILQLRCKLFFILLRLGPIIFLDILFYFFRNWRLQNSTERPNWYSRNRNANLHCLNASWGDFISWEMWSLG